MELECAGTRVHRVNGELPEEKRHFSRWEYRVAALLVEPSEAISILSFAEHACDEGGRKRFAVLETKVRRRNGGERTLLRSPARKSGQDLQGVAASH